MQTPDERKIIRDKGPKITLALAPRLDPNRTMPENLDLEHPDHRVVEQISAYIATCPAENVKFLSNDTLALATARDCSVPFLIMPPDWLLKPAPDEATKRMEKRILELERTSPMLALGVVDTWGKPIDQLVISVRDYAPLSEQRIAQLLEHAKRLCPEQVYPGAFKPQPDGRMLIDLYPWAYRQWTENVQKFFELLPDMLAERSRQGWLVLTVENTGTVPAELVALNVTVSDGFYLEGPKTSDPHQWKSRLVPPHWHPPWKFSGNIAEYQYNFPSPIRFSERPPGQFGSTRETGDFKSKPESWSRFGDLVCEKLAHRTDPQRIPMKVIVPRTIRQKSGELCCRISADNVAQPVMLKRPIRVVVETEDIEAQLKQLVVGLDE